MLAFFSVPAACIARSAATITAIPPLSSPAPGPLRQIAFAGPALERRIRLEHRVEMGDQQQPLAAPGCPMWRATRWPGAAGRLHVDPFGLEAELLELGLDHPAHRLDPGKFIVPLFWSTQRWSMAVVRACSASTVRIITCSGGDSAAAAGAEAANAQMRKKESGCSSAAA